MRLGENSNEAKVAYAIPKTKYEAVRMITEDWVSGDAVPT